MVCGRFRYDSFSMAAITSLAALRPEPWHRGIQKEILLILVCLFARDRRFSRAKKIFSACASRRIYLNTRDFVAKFESVSVLWTIIVILLVLWLLGLLGHVGGSLIHLLLVIAVIVLIINLVRGRGAP